MPFEHAEVRREKRCQKRSNKGGRVEEEPRGIHRRASRNTTNSHTRRRVYEGGGACLIHGGTQQGARREKLEKPKWRVSDETSHVCG